ncbi:MAG: alpha/beta hydrolase [Pseudomonadota bacterium]
MGDDPTLEAAPFYADIADGPQGGHAVWLKTEDGLRIRMSVWDGQNSGANKGTVLIFPGRTEYIEKYGRAAGMLAERGYSSIAVDWRGQGLGERMLEDRALGHVEKFSDYQYDVAAVLSAVKSMGLPDPIYLFAHSMGGCIGLRALMEDLPVRAAMFTGPMWDILLPQWRRTVGWVFTSFSRKVGLDGNLAPGSLRTSYVEANPFQNNMLTSDPDMFEYMRDQLNKYPDLGLGGPSNAWVHEALKECRSLKLRPTPSVPTLVFLGTNERIVEPAAIKERMARWPNGKLVLVDGAEHEVAMETPAIQASVFDQTAAHFAAHS